jgi:hypothetical protein
MNPNLTPDERSILAVLGIDILDNDDLKRLFRLRNEQRSIVRKLIPWAKARRSFLARLESNPLGDFYSLSK